MITSPTPWSITPIGTCAEVKDKTGKPVAYFLNYQDAEVVVELSKKSPYGGMAPFDEMQQKISKK